MSLTYIIPYLQIFNTLTTVVLNLSPIVIFIPVIKGRQSYTNIPFLMLLFNLLNGLCWSSYWYRRSFTSPLICNFLCSLISTTFFIIYLFFLSKKIVPKCFLYIMILIIVATIIIYISIYVINIQIYGIILIVINVLMFVGPSQNIIRVIKEKNHRLIPIATTLVMIVCSGGWLLFGKIVNDLTCIIPNMIGLFFSVFNSLIWLFFYLKEKIKKNKNQFYSEENANNNNVEIK